MLKPSGGVLKKLFDPSRMMARKKRLTTHPVEDKNATPKFKLRGGGRFGDNRRAY